MSIFSNRAIQKRSEIFCFAQNDIGRWIVILVSLVKEKRMPIRAKYVHTNLIARDWKRLVRFYREVFGCEPKGPERDLSAAWLDRVN